MIHIFLDRRIINNESQSIKQKSNRDEGVDQNKNDTESEDAFGF